MRRLDFGEEGRLARIILRQALFWFVLWGFWVIVSRHNHPTLKLNAIATGLLVATFAGAVYLNHFWLIPRFWNARRFAFYAAALPLVTAVLAFVCTIAIHVVYDLLWGPDPARFGFWTNFGMEFALTAFHVFMIATAVRLFRWINLTRKRQNWTRSSA